MARTYEIANVCKNLEDRRDAAGLEQADVAKGANIPRTTYANYETGGTGMSFEAAWKLANFYGCSLDELGGREWPPAGAAA